MADILLYFIGVILPYISVGVLIGGLIYRVLTWLRVPVPVRIPLTPAPITRAGVIGRLGTEFFVFRSLMKANKKLWFGGYLFHVMLGVTFIVHLINIFLYSLYSDILGCAWFDLLATYSGLIFGFALAFLIFRRLLLRPIRVLSKVPDYLILVLLISIIILGNYLRSVVGVDINAVRSYFASLVVFRPTLPPDNIFFLIHYLLAMILFIYIPFSKVGHIIGWILSPTRNMRNISRYQRHINPWNEEVEGEIEPWEEYYKRFKDQLEQIGPGGERR